MLVLAGMLLAAALAGNGTGCQKRILTVCGEEWETNETYCEACVKSHIKQLEPNCTLQRAMKKCQDPPVAPTAPPTTPPSPAPAPTPPLPGAPQPHIVLFVTDDQGWANVGYHNPKNVKTPHIDQLVAAGIELGRHYVYRWCAPTRSALMTGRLPFHVLETSNYVAKEMTMLPAKLKQVGYATHQIGKWHLGCLFPWMTPVGRGFDSSLGYLSGGEDHYTHFQKSLPVFGCEGVDLYQSDHPLLDKNGTYGAFLYGDEAVRVVEQHDLTNNQSLFMYVALQVMHAPQEVPEQWSNLYPSPAYDTDYSIMNGMASASDEVLGNLTGALKRRGMWSNTLLVYTSDNGGPAGQASSGHSGNNWPLRGGKTNVFEGGIRVVAFVSGGFLSAGLQGIKKTGYIHGADWYATLCHLAGVDPEDTPSPNPTNVPPIDSKNMWPYLSGAVSASPRTQMLISSGTLPVAGGALIDGDFKLVLSNQTYGFWQAPVYPNASTDHSKEKIVDCGKGCLFNIQKDPSEYNDLAATMPDKLADMQQLFKTLTATKWEAEKWPVNEAKCKAYVTAHGGLGPYL